MLFGSEEHAGCPQLIERTLALVNVSTMVGCSSTSEVARRTAASEHAIVAVLQTCYDIMASFVISFVASGSLYSDTTTVHTTHLVVYSA